MNQNEDPSNTPPITVTSWTHQAEGGGAALRSHQRGQRCPALEHGGRRSPSGAVSPRWFAAAEQLPALPGPPAPSGGTRSPFTLRTFSCPHHHYEPSLPSVPFPNLSRHVALNGLFINMKGRYSYYLRFDYPHFIHNFKSNFNKLGLRGQSG